MAILKDWPWEYWSAIRPDAIALAAEEGWSWLRLSRETARLAHAFRRQGVGEGSCVALRGKNGVPMLLCYLALLRCGARLLPLNPQLPGGMTDALLPSLNVDFALCLQDLPWPAGVTALVAEASGEDVSALPPWRPDRLATLTLTSGSGGLPKAAAHTFAAHLDNAAGVLRLMRFDAQGRWLLSLPLFHVSGQGIVWRWLLAGAALTVRAGQPLASALQGCTHASLVPTQLWRLLAQAETPPTLRAVLLGGAAIPPELTRRAEERGIRCWCGYGLTEFASTVCAGRADGRPGVGFPLAGREMRLAGEEILLRGSGMTAGYWRDGRLQPAADEEGWFHTRDRGRLDEDGWYILGRLDNQFFSGGEGIQPEDIEAVLLRHSAVRQAFVVPVDDDEYGQRPVAVVEGGETLELAQLRDWLAPQVAGFQRPVAYYRLPEELKNGGIKISRHQVMEWVRRRASHAR